MEILAGAAVSLVAQYLKNKFGMESNTTLAVVLGLSIIAATVYVLLKDTALWPTLLQVIVTAGAFYTYILKRFV